MLAQLASALEALHALGAVHRDLKGDNVLISHSDGRAMLTDFGLGSLPGAERLTPPALCLGTPLYRSPEAGLFELNSKELAEALERASHPPPERARPRELARPRWSWLALAAGFPLAVWAGWAFSERFAQKPSLAQARTEAAGQEDADTAGLGEAASTASTEQAPKPSLHEPLAEAPLPEPLPGQVRPDARGRCPHKGQVALNDACWVPLNLAREQCEALGSKLFKGRCYVPAMSTDRPSTSHPTRTP